MSNLYTDRFNIHKIFSQNEYQKILIGSSRENPEQIVVINIINKANTKDVISTSQFSKGLANLISLEKTEDEFIIITDYHEGTPLTKYLEYFDATPKNRINLAYEYLNKAVHYDVFNNSLKSLLIDESQIVIKDNTLFFNELLILNEDVKEYKKFDNVIKILVKILEKIIYVNEPNETFEDESLTKVANFIDKLKNDDHNYINLEEIYEDFRKIYIYELYLNQDSNEIPKNLDEKSSMEQINVSSTKSEEDEEDLDYQNLSNVREILLGNSQVPTIDEVDKSSKTLSFFQKLLSKKVFIAGIILCLLGSIAYGLTGFLSNSKSQKPEALFTREKINNDTWYFANKSKIYGEDNEIKEVLWEISRNNKLLSTSNKKNLTYSFENEGEYTITLTIKDRYDGFSTYSENLNYKEIQLDSLNTSNNSSEKLENLNLNTESNSVNKDYDIYRSGTYSFIIGKDNNKEETIVTKNLEFKNDPIISMWLASKTKQSIKIDIVGFNNGNISFNESYTYNFNNIESWDLFQTDALSKNIDEVRIRFYDYESPFWVDDIVIEPYK